MKVRQDAWSHEDDVLLAETVLKHIKEGSTQLRAFDEVGDELHRTSAACGFRWNAVVRQKYISDIREAKKERKERKRAASYLSSVTKRAVQPELYMPQQQSVNQPISLSVVIEYLKTLNTESNGTQALKRENEKLLKENLDLLTKNKELEAELSKLQNDHHVIEEDYQSLIQIMNRARRMAILQDDDSIAPATFKMDKNGNLEKVAK